jgi:NAD(P)-dependent dehydrogenase (short-subunit alcohol dehydrogenase family)
MRRELRGKRVILTGATGGIGRATATALVQAGSRLAIAARSADVLEGMAEDLRRLDGDVVAVPGDVTVAADRERLVATTVQLFGGLDILINNSGVGSFGHFATSTEEVVRRVMEVNFFGPVELIRLAASYLMKGSQTAVVNVASMTGRRGMPAWPEYSASKFALVGMSEALRGEFARFDIDVLTIVPGLTNSGFDRHVLRRDGKMNIPFGRGMPPEEVAAGIVRAIRTGRRETVLGLEARWMLRLNRFVPRVLNWVITRKVKRLYAQPAPTP